MKPFNFVTGSAVPLMLDNVDTDVIVRINRLTTLARDQMGPYALEALRFLPDGTQDPACILNQTRFRSAPTLLAGRNFGCGSSREGAVWALAGFGIRCIVAESFGDIFFSNCFQNGLLPVRLSRDRLNVLAAQVMAGESVTVSLEDSCITFPDGSKESFSVEPMKRLALLEGIDDITRTLTRRSVIQAWQAADRLNRPWVWNQVEILPGPQA